MLGRKGRGNSPPVWLPACSTASNSLRVRSKVSSASPPNSVSRKFECMMRNAVVCLILLVSSGACLAQTHNPLTGAAPAPGANSMPTGSPQNWFSVYGRCREAVRKLDVQKGVDLCQQALNLAKEAGDQTPRDQIALLQSWESYGQALLALGRGPEALDAENQAVILAKAHLHESDQEYAMPFYWRALVESHFHDGVSASGDLTIVEDSYGKALAASPRMRPIYEQYLARILRQHAALLDAMGKSADGDKLRAEAASLKPL